MMSWGAKIKAALHGDMDGADVAALLAASRVLAALRQDLEGRRLDLQLAHATAGASPTPAIEEWRVADALGEIAARLWLVENLVMLAQSLYDAESDAHPEAPGAMSGIAHSQALALLQPMESIIAEVSAALVDPTPPTLVGAASLGPATRGRCGWPAPCIIC